MKFEDKFYRTPFLFILFSLMAGIVLSSLSFHWLWYVVSGSLLLFLIFTLPLFIKSSVDWRFYLAMFAFVVLGYFLGFSKAEIDNRSLGDAVTSCELEVLEFNESDGVWNKGIGRIHARVEKEKLIPLNRKVVFYSRTALNEGDFILVRTKWKRIKNRNNPGEFDAESYWKSKGISRMGFINEDDYFLVDHRSPGIVREFIQTSRAHFSNVLDQVLSNEVKGIGKAIILGDKSDLATEARSSFSNAGASHVLAVSGLHVGIIMVILLAFFKQFARVISRRTALIMVLFITWVYAAITGFSPSVLRAVIMFSILLGGGIWSRRSNNLNVLAFSATIMLLYDPNLILDLGFQLSYLAVLGIFLLYNPISKLLRFRTWILQKAWEGTVVGIAAQIFTVPVTLYYFHQFPNYFFISNLGVMILAGLILATGLILMTVSWLPYLAKYIGLVLGILLFFLLFFIQLVESIPGSVANGFEVSYTFVVIYFILVILVVLSLDRNKQLMYLGASFIVLLFVIQWNRWDALTKSEIVFYNATTPIVSLKSGDEILCFHSESDKSLKDAKRLISDYARVRPGRVTFIPFSSGLYQLSGQMKGVIDVREEVIWFDLQEFKGGLILSPKEERRLGYQLFSLPYLSTIPGITNLDSGAYQHELKNPSEEGFVQTD